MRFATALSLLVVTYNNVANRWPAFHSWAYIPLNLAFAVVVTLGALVAAQIPWAEISGDVEVSDLALPMTLVVSFAVIVFAVARSRVRHLIADERVADRRGRSLAYYVLLRIPVGTAVVEELVFRGVLFAAWRDAGAPDLVAAMYASIAFGLWHIQPTIVGLRMNDPDASKRKVTAAVLGAVVATTVAGLGLTWLRWWSGSLLGPVLLHAGINSLGALGAASAHRHIQKEDPTLDRRASAPHP